MYAMITPPIPQNIPIQRPDVDHTLFVRLQHQNKQVVSFRDSKLTRLCQDFFSGSGKVPQPQSSETKVDSFARLTLEASGGDGGLRESQRE